MDRCAACGGTEEAQRLLTREMVLGLRDPFTYVACADCCTLRLVEVPEDIARYYPADYYAFQRPAVPSRGLKKWLKRRLLAYRLGARDPIGRLLAARYRLPPFADWMARSETGPDDPILDVGCGAGDLLFEMAGFGCRYLTGLDPHLPEDFCPPEGPVPPGGVRLLREEITEHGGAYRLIMFHHVLEHLSDPAAALTAAGSLLMPAGTILVRTPLADSEAFRTYGPDWFGLEAPRHRHVFTREGLGLLAESSRLLVEYSEDDALPSQFWASEQYRRDIPLHDPRSFAAPGGQGLFTESEMDVWIERTRAVNARGDGDQGAFYLRRRSQP